MQRLRGSYFIYRHPISPVCTCFSNESWLTAKSDFRFRNFRFENSFFVMRIPIDFEDLFSHDLSDMTIFKFLIHDLWYICQEKWDRLKLGSYRLFDRTPSARFHRTCDRILLNDPIFGFEKSVFSGSPAK